MEPARDDAPPDHQQTPSPSPPSKDLAVPISSEEDPESGSATATTPGDNSGSGANDSSNPTGSPTCLSSWSTSSDHQLGHGTQADPSDRVFPIRSVITVEPAWATANERHTMSVSEGQGAAPAAGPGVRPSLAATPRLTLDGPDRQATASPGMPRPASPAVRPPVPQRSSRQRRKNTMSGSMSSIQADAERQGTATLVPLIIGSTDDDDDDESVAAFDISQDSMSISSYQSASRDGTETLYSQRFKHVVTEEGHAVITGRDGTLQRCEDEPIHMPGAVQAFGMMVAIHEEPDGRFSVRYVSENSKRFIGRSPQELFKLADFLDILTEEQAENLLDHIDFIRDEDADPASNGPEVFSLSVRVPGKSRAVKLWCAIHAPLGLRDTIICEFEMDDDDEYPLRPPDEETPTMPEDTLQTNPTVEELTESTEIMSRPLRVLRSARKRRGEAGAMQVFDIMSQVQEQLAKAPNLQSFLKILVGIVKELTGFHRVMVYQFDSSFNGKVVTELVDPAQTRDLYMGLHFPVTDIPKQARELYKLNRVRLLYDRDLESARIVCRSMDELETPLDMTHAYLRAMSPIHLRYLANMAVRSSMSISINAFGDLWGLIACHSYGHKGMRVSFPIRKMCRLVGDTVSRNIERLSYASRLQARKLINTVPTDKNPSGYIIASSDDLLKLFDADFGMLSIREETKILGRIEQSQEALAMLEYLRLRKFTSVVMTQDVKAEFPDLRYPPGFSVIAGLLYVPLSVGGNDFIVFFRKGQIREVKWAGNPYEKLIKQGTQGYLEPRMSFKVWHETVMGKCREWSEEQVETAAVLCLVYGKFIEVWRQKEAALQNSRLTRLLLANSAHEVRTPLNAIINYLEIALEGSLDQETRDNLARSHSASKSLIYVINDLLDLTQTEEGQELVKDEIFDLPACVREGTDPFRIDARRKGIEYDFIEHPGLPKFVYGDQRRVRQAVANVTANAVKHTTEGSIKVELYVAEVLDRRVWVEIVVQDTGEGMTDTQLDALFRDLEQVSLDEGPVEGDTPEDQQKRTLGLGLAVVARILRNMDGQLRLKSEQGKGSRFVIQLPFDLPPDDPSATTDGMETPTAATLTSSNNTAVSALPAASRDGEVMLVDRGRSGSTANAAQIGSLSPLKPYEEVRATSDQRSITSRGSARSTMSDAERLIDAIQMPLTLGDPEPEDAARQRQTSRTPYCNPSAGRDLRPSRSMSPSGRIVRPPGPSRSESMSAAKMTEPVGMQFVTDSRIPVKPVKVPDEYQPLPELPKPAEPSGGLFEVTSVKGGVEVNKVAELPKPAKLHVLVAEDDPINVKVLQKRLEKAGHKVTHAVNGEDCATVYQERSGDFDVVLMDMQMPIVDGLTSTKMIREFEQSDKHGGLSTIADRHGRIPVIAVSASLVEREKDTYVQAGFDGWILKPIDFKRLETLLKGIVDDGVRTECLYVAGEWERGGWLTQRQERSGGGKTEERSGEKLQEGGPSASG